MLTFTDDQFKNTTKDTLLLPFLINDPANGLIAQKNLMLATADGLDKTDKSQKVFSDFYEDCVKKYHQEIALISNSLRTDYSDADLVSAGKGSGPHYPQGTWLALAPKLIDSVIGLPVTTHSNPYEQNIIQGVSDFITLLTTGFHDGGTGMTVTVGAGSFSSTSGLGDIATNQRVMLSNGSQMFLVKITGVSSSTVTPTPPAPPVTTTTATFTFLSGTQFTGSASAQNNFGGFSNAQRNGTASTAPNTYIFNQLTSAIDTSVTNWKAHIQSIKTLVDSNGDLPPRKAHNQTASTNCGNAMTTIADWQAKPASTTSGRFTDTNIAIVSGLASSRGTYIASRITEIIADLGTVTQTPDGAFSGSGAYFDLFKNIDLRAARGAGTLSRYNDALLGLTFFDKKIAGANDQLTQYNNTFAITKISADTIIGQNTFTVESATGFSVNDEVKLMDNNGSVYTRTIIEITGNSIKVNTGVPAVLATSGMARIVKMK